MNICYEIGSRLYRQRVQGRPVQPVDASRSTDEYWDWQYQTSPGYFDKFWDLSTRLPGARVLDIGCGLGGRTCYLATAGARSVVGIDINAEEITLARDLAARMEAPGIQARVSFQTVRENAPIDLDPFDVVMLVDSMEHVRDPVAMLNLAYSMTRPGGVCYFGTVGWYHYNAAHLMGIVPIPFLTVFFSDAIILDAVRRIVSLPEYQPTAWDSDPPVMRYAKVNDLRDRPGEQLNKITVQGLRRAMKQSLFGGGRLQVTGFSWRQFPWMRWMNGLARIPGIQEIYHSGCLGRMERKD